MRCWPIALLVLLTVQTAVGHAQTTYTWNAAANGSYTDPTQWSGSVVPAAGQDAVISATGSNYTVTLSANAAAKDLLINSANATLNQTGGAYTLTGDLTVNAGLYFLNGGTISGGTIVVGGTGDFQAGTSTGSVLSGVTINSAVDFSTANSKLRLQGGSQFASGLTLNLGTGAILGANQSQAINAGALTINMGNNSTVSTETANAQLTLGSGVILNLPAGNTGNLTSNAMGLGSNGNITSAAAINLNGTGSALVINNSGTFANSGTITGAAGSTLSIGPNGNYAMAMTNTGTITTAGTLNLVGYSTSAPLTANNANGTISVTSGGGTTFGNASLTGGTFTTNGTPFKVTTNSSINVLTNVTLDATAFDLKNVGTYSYLQLAGTTAFGAGTTVDLTSPSGSVLGVNQTATLNNFTVALNGGAYFAVEGNNTVTLGSGATLTLATTGTAQIGRNYNVSGSSASLVNQGLIQTTSTGTLLFNSPGSFTNTGTIQATAAGTITIDVGSGGFNASTGTISLVAGSTLNLQGSISGLGTITRGGTVAGTAGTVILNGSGTLTLGADLDFNQTTGPLLMNTFTIMGGGHNLLNTGSATIAPQTGANANYNTFNNVQIGVGALNLTTANGVLTLTNGSNFAAGSAYTTGSGFTLQVTQTQAVNNLALSLGSGAVLTEGSSTTLTIGSTSDIKATAAGTAGVYSNSAAAVNNGVIENTGSGNLNVYASGGFTNAGTLRVTSPATGGLVLGTGSYAFTNQSGGLIDTQSGTAYLQGNWTNAGTIKLASGATLNLQGSFADSSLGTILRGGTQAGTAGTLQFSGAGTLTLGANLDFNLTTGPVLMNTFTVMGGGYSLLNTGSATIAPQTGANANYNTFNNVQIGVGALNLTTANGVLTLTNGSNFAAGSAYTTGSGFALQVTQTQAINNLALSLGSGAVLTEGSSTTLTIGSTSDIKATAAGTAGVYSNSAAAVNNGVIENTGSGNLNVYASGGFTNSGTLQVTGTSASVLNLGSGSYAFTNQSAINVQSGTANLMGNWTNAGTFQLSPGATLNLQGSFTQASLGTILRGGTQAGTAGTLQFSGAGTLTLGANLDFNLTTGPVLMNTFTVMGGGYSLLNTGSATIAPQTGANANYNTFNNVQIGVGALNLTTANGVLTLTNGSNFAAGSAYTTGSGFALQVTQTQAINNLALSLGSGAVLTEGSSTTLTIGSTSDIKATAAGTAGVYSNSAAAVNNGVIENTGSGNLNVYASGGFTNSGTLRVTSPATGTLSLGSSGTTFLNQSGAYVTVQSGTANLNGNWTNSATIQVASGATLNLSGSMSLSNVGGSIAVAAGGLTTFGTASLTGGTFTTNGGTFRVTTNSGTTPINVLTNVAFDTTAFDLKNVSSYSYLQLAGTTTFGAGSSFDLTSPSGSVLGVNQTATLNNFTVALDSTAYFAVEGNNTVTLGSGAVITMATTGTAGVGRNFAVTGTSASLVNQGLIQNTSTGTLTINPPSTFTNSGTIQATAGTLNFGSATVLSNYTAATQTLSGGTYRAVGSGTVNFGTWTVSTIAAGTAVEIGGTGTFAAINGLQVDNGTFTVSGGRSFSVANSANSFSNGGTLNVSGTGTFTIGNAITLTNYASNTLTGGTWNISNTAALNLGSASIATLASGTAVTLTTNASVPALNALSAINSGATLQLLNGQNLSVAGSLANAGTLVLGGGTLTVPGTFANTGSLTGSGTITSPANFNTGGSVAVSGTITLGSTLAVNAATTLSSGTLNVTGTTTLNNSFTVAAGATYGGGGTAVVPGGQTLTVNGTVDAAKPVSLTGTLGGYGAVNGTVTANAGALIEGIGGTLSLATLTVAGNASIAGSVTASGTTSITGASLTVGGESSLGGSGSITVGSGGSLVVPTISSAVSQTVTVQSGGRTNGTGSLGSLVIQSGGLLKPGNSPGTISIQSGVSDAGVVEIDIPTGTPGASTTPGTSNGAVMVQSGNSTVRTGAIIQVKTDSVGAPSFAPGAFWGTAESWLIWSTQNGQFVDSNGTPTTNPGFGYAMVDSNETPVPNYANYGAFSTAVFNSTSVPSTITLDWTPVPEPASLVSLAALGFCGVVCGCRKRSLGRTDVEYSNQKGMFSKASVGVVAGRLSVSILPAACFPASVSQYPPFRPSFDSRNFRSTKPLNGYRSSSSVQPTSSAILALLIKFILSNAFASKIAWSASLSTSLKPGVPSDSTFESSRSAASRSSAKSL